MPIGCYLLTFVLHVYLHKGGTTNNSEKRKTTRVRPFDTNLQGRDMIGVAQTGSGKTLAFVWPALVHLMDQREIVKGKEGPIVVVLAPTRELAGQIYSEANKFAKR